MLTGGLVALLAGVGSCARKAVPPAQSEDASHAMTSAATNGVVTDERLASLRDSKRVLLVFAPSEADPRWQRQKELWKDAADAFADRDIVTLLALEHPSQRSDEVARRYGAGTNDFLVVLIGKDGHQAFRGADPVTALDLEERIDAMPMRRDEVRRRGR